VVQTGRLRRVARRELLKVKEGTERGKHYFSLLDGGGKRERRRIKGEDGGQKKEEEREAEEEQRRERRRRNNPDGERRSGRVVAEQPVLVLVQRGRAAAEPCDRGVTYLKGQWRPETEG
jgi:hypothetical protein